MHFAHKTSAALALVALGLTTAHPALAQTAYTFITLNDPLAGVYTTTNGTLSGTVVNGINDSGEVAGYYYDSAGNHGFVETPSGGFTTIADPGVVGSTGAIGINNAGQVAGAYSDGTATYGFVETPGSGGFQKISEPSVTGTGSTIPDGISASGQVIGNYTDSTDPYQHGFIDTPEAGGTSFFAGLADPSTTGSTIAKGINTSGQVVGYTTSGGIQTSFLLAPGGGFADFSDPAAPKHTIATGINDMGLIAGYYLANNGQYGFVETPGVGGAAPTFLTLSDPAATSGIFVEGINNEGQISGYYRDSNSVYHGFLAIPAAVPEASSFASFGLLLMGMGSLMVAVRRRTKAAA